MAIDIENVFAQNGDTTVVPQGTQVDGSVNFDEGYTSNYQLDPDTDPNALDIERNKMNYLFNVLYANQKELVKQGFNNHIVGKEYDTGNVVRGTDGVLYQSNIDSNTDTPPSANWQEFGVSSDRVLATPEVQAEGQNWNGISYSDPDAVGANPTALIYPDGTVVGSTDNGSYTKYPNGDLICRRTISGATANGATINYPVNFIDTNYQIGHNSSVSTDRIMNGITKTISSFVTSFINSASQPVSVNGYEFTAIGRWK